MGIDVVMLAHSKQELTDKDIRDLSFKLCEAVGHEEFWLDVKKGRFALSKAGYDAEYLYDQPVGGTLLQVNTLWRYYGPGYERGPWPTIFTTMTWLALNGLTVYYGGDSGGAEGLKLVTSEFVDEMWQHFSKAGHAPYSDRFGSGDPQCMCPYCQNSMRAYMWGGYHSFVQYHCPGCGYEARTDDMVTFKEALPNDPS